MWISVTVLSPKFRYVEERDMEQIFQVLYDYLKGKRFFRFFRILFMLVSLLVLCAAVVRLLKGL